MATLTSLTARLDAGHSLSRDDITRVMQWLLDPAETDDNKAGFLTALARKGETADEIAGFALELRARALDPGIDPARHGGVLLDVCGTGADLAHTINISSCVMFVAAAAGIAVVKHGNRAITSRSGSADVLAALGARIEMPPEMARACLERCGITFLFAPLYHPAFKSITPVRKKLAEQKQRTVFNILGPLVNPAKPTHQIVGIFDKSRVAVYARVLGLIGLQRALVVHGDGLDELTTLGVNTAVEWRDGRATSMDVAMPALFRPNPTLAELAGGDPSENAGIVRAVLSGKERGARRDIVQLNAAAALYVAGKANDLAGGWTLAGLLLDDGTALRKLEEFIAASNG